MSRYCPIFVALILGFSGYPAIGKTLSDKPKAEKTIIEKFVSGSNIPSLKDGLGFLDYDKNKDAKTPRSDKNN